MKTYTDKVIESYKRGSIYQCGWCFKQRHGRYTGSDYVNDGLIRFCSDTCKLQFKTDDVDPSNGGV